MKRIIPPPPPPEPVKKAMGCMVPLLIGAAILATAVGVWPSLARADTCTLPTVTTCTVMMCLKCADGGDGTQYCSSGGVVACNKCTPDPALWMCTRPDGTTYSKPAFVELTPPALGTPPGMDTRGMIFRGNPPR